MSDVSGAYYDWTTTGKPERPYIHAYHRTVVFKVFLARKLAGGGSEVCLSFAEAREVLRRLDNITCGIPKVAYLVGWQFDGHDSKYPSWAEVNRSLKRPEDATAEHSLRWLMEDGLRLNTTVSLHVNMIDAFADSPLWEEYVAKDVIAKDREGNCLTGETFDAGQVSYQLSYAREWETGLAQRRIDGLLAMLPIERAGTIHIDAFHSRAPVREHDDCISPFLGYSIEREMEAQRRIFRYFRDRGVDVTCEGSAYWLRPDPFVGLQPMAYHFTPVEGCPPDLYCGTPMKAEPEILADPVGLTGLPEQFYRSVLPWYHANAGIDDGSVLEADFVCASCPWQEGLSVVWSRDGMAGRACSLPSGCRASASIEVYAIETEGPRLLGTVEAESGSVALTLEAGQGVALLPAGVPPNWGAAPYLGAVGPM